MTSSSSCRSMQPRNAQPFTHGELRSESYGRAGRARIEIIAISRKKFRKCGVKLRNLTFGRSAASAFCFGWAERDERHRVERIRLHQFDQRVAIDLHERF